jgi:hypothetical protein
MKKKFFLLFVLCVFLSACMPASLQPNGTSPTPAPKVDIQATVALSVEQTLQSLPSPTQQPTHTPLVMTATSTLMLPTPTSSITPTLAATIQQSPTLRTLTATQGTGTVTLTLGTVGTLPFSATPNPAFSVTPTATNHFQYYGTMPPNLPSGTIWLRNVSKADSYVSLQCTTTDGYVTIIEYPVGRSTVKADAPAGKYVYVAWVGGKKFTGSFKLGKFQELTITMNKDRVGIK